MRKAILGLAIVLITALVSACGPGPTAVINGVATEYIMNTEQLGNGSTLLWLGNDTTTAYCTSDKEVAGRAIAWQESHWLVSLTYATINAGEMIGQCDYGQKGVTMLRLVKLDLSLMASQTATAEAKAK